MALADTKAKAIFDEENMFLLFLWAKGDSWLIKVNLLSRGFFLVAKALFNGEAVISVGFEENEAIICEEKVCDTWASSGDSNALQLILTCIEVEQSQKPLRVEDE